MRLLFPRLPYSAALRIAEDLAVVSVTAARARAASHHALQTFAPTGGKAITVSELDGLAERVRAVAESFGYPEPRGTNKQDAFDGKLAALLHSSSGLDAAEASVGEVWSFFGCVLLPDVARWRFPGEQESTRVVRLVGQDRGQRNTFGRLWWRAQLLRVDDALFDPYQLVGKLGEDELVGILERSRAVGSPRVARGLARALIASHGARPRVARMDIARDGLKRFRRLAAFVRFESMPDAALDRSLRELFDASAGALEREKVGAAT